MDMIPIEEIKQMVEANELPATIRDTSHKVCTDLSTDVEQQSEANTKEKKRIRKRIRTIWNNYRSNFLSKMDLETYKQFCQLEIERANTDLELLEIKNKRELVEIAHWLEKHKGNLEELKYNTKSKPSLFWYKCNRGIFYMKNTCSNIPKITWYLLAGVLGVGIVILMSLGISKLF